MDFLAGGGDGEGDLAAVLPLEVRCGVSGSTLEIGLFFGTAEFLIAINAATSSTSSSEKSDFSDSEFSVEDPPEDPVEDGTPLEDSDLSDLATTKWV